MMLNSHEWLAFFVAAITINLLPGSDTVYVVARTLSQGTRAGLVSVVGIFTGCMCHVSAAAFGLSLLIARSAVAYQTIRYAGALYLIYVGACLLRKRRTAGFPAPVRNSAPLWVVYRQAGLTNVLNPKVALFFLAFLPQFVDRHSSSAGLKMALLGVIFSTTGCIYLSTLSIAVGKTRHILSRSKRFVHIQQSVSGSILILLGLGVAAPETL